MKGFRQYGYSRVQRFAQRSQHLLAACVLGVLRVKQRHTRPRIYQNHRLSFLLIASRTPWRVSVDGAVAYPPDPRANSA
jgi:hypothetical protein